MAPFRTMLGRTIAGLLAAIWLASPSAALSLAPEPPLRCHDGRDTARPLRIRVDGKPATGRYAVPRGHAQGLVVFAHGYGHTAYSWDEHLEAAARHGLIAVAMNYRGLEVFPDSNDDGLPESRGWNAMAGAEDSLAAGLLVQELCHVRTSTILGVSMGGNMSGLALALAGERGLTRDDGAPVFDYWVDVEGATNLTETYLEARGAAAGIETAANARDDIEAETGGTIEEVPEEYERRTVVARVGDLAASGVRGIIAIHGIDDGLVPHNQSRELVALTRQAGIPTEMLTIGRRDEDSERETTATGHAAGAVYPDYLSPLAGHASEKSTTHIVMETALDRLWSLMGGNAPVDRECLVNGQTPDPAATLCS